MLCAIVPLPPKPQRPWPAHQPPMRIIRTRQPAISANHRFTPQMRANRRPTRRLLPDLCRHAHLRSGLRKRSAPHHLRAFRGRGVRQPPTFPNQPHPSRKSSTVRSARRLPWRLPVWPASAAWSAKRKRQPYGTGGNHLLPALGQPGTVCGSAWRPSVPARPVCRAPAHRCGFLRPCWYLLRLPSRWWW